MDNIYMVELFWVGSLQMVSEPIPDPDVESVRFGPVGGVCPFSPQSHMTQLEHCSWIGVFVTSHIR